MTFLCRKCDREWQGKWFYTSCPECRGVEPERREPVPVTVSVPAVRRAPRPNMTPLERELQRQPRDFQSELERAERYHESRRGRWSQ